MTNNTAVDCEDLEAPPPPYEEPQLKIDKDTLVAPCLMLIAGILLIIFGILTGFGSGDIVGSILSIFIGGLIILISCCLVWCCAMRG